MTALKRAVAPNHYRAEANPYGRGDKDWSEARRLIDCARNHVRRRMSARTREETSHG